MIKLKNDLLLRAISKQPVEMTPIWLMRQAGRYLPEYKKVRQKAGSFLTLCKTPDLACEVTLQPLRRFALDAAILFSDILTIPDAMGLGLHFIEGEGPVFDKPIRTENDVANLRVPEPESDLTYVLDAVKLIQHELDGSVPLIGFCGSPWTLATYMIEGRANKTFPLIQKLLSENPAMLHALLEKLAVAVANHLNAQITAGANLVKLFDTWGGLLNSENYKLFSLSYMQKIISEIKRKHPTTPIILFTKGGGQWLQDIANTGCHMVGLDAQTDIGSARQQIGEEVALEGNLEPSVLLKSPEIIRQEVSHILERYGHGSGHVFNLGHGVTPDVPPDHVAVLVDAVHEISRRYHANL